MTIATEYTEEWLQHARPQPMWDKRINHVIEDYHRNGVKRGCPDENVLYDVFKEEFEFWMHGSINCLLGFDAFPVRDICIGCTQFIDNLYMREGIGVQVFEGDYKYHWRLNNNIRYATLDTLDATKDVLIALPFPATGDIHPNMEEILDKCYNANIPVHIDGAWITCSKDITFNFNHPAIHSFAISLSKGLGLGWNRIGVRYSRTRQTDSIGIMNDFNMNCRSLTWMGLHFIRSLEPDYFWLKYGEAYETVCRDFDLEPTNTIHLALQNGDAVGVRPLLRYLEDK